MSEREISCQISKKRKLLVASVPTAPPSGAKSCQSELTTFAPSAPAAAERDCGGSLGVIRILVESVDRHGRSSASLPDGTVLVDSSRQPFLDAARVLIRAGYDADSWLEAWRPHSTAFALRGRPRFAAGLSIDETRTVFARWKAFSSSAVPSSVGYSEAPAITLALGNDELPEPLPDQSLDTSAGRLPSVEGEAQ
jgi:hypothetical protein